MQSQDGKLTREQIEEATEYINAVGFVATPNHWRGLADILQYAPAGPGTPAQAPAPDAELVERMIEAVFATSETETGVCVATWGSSRDIWRKWMTAALRIAADALLGPVTDAERDDDSFPSLDALLAARRGGILTPAKTETIQERVEHILTKHFKTIGVVDAAEEIIATLKEGK